jgi:2-polyprenyl-3-methyl-5-hydroxy-6-metoxy-1,4-benzoquinol methylase
MAENRKCLVCGSHTFVPIYEGLLMQCGQCAFATANLDMGKLDFEGIYDEAYFKGREYLDYPMEKSIIQKNLSNKLKSVNREIDKNDVSNILEIGCAYGFFGELMKKHYPEGKYTGIDISENAIEYGKMELGLDLHSVDFLDFKTNEVYSDIYMWDVIEHLQEPGKVIAKVSAELKKNGRLILTTGDFGSWLARLQKRKWRLVHPPTHLHYFSKKTMTRLLEDNNFRVISISYPSIIRSLKQTWYSLFLLDKKQNSISKSIFRKLPDLNIKLNTFDIMMVIAVKR